MAQRSVGRNKATEAARRLLENSGMKTAPIDVDRLAELQGIDVIYEDLARDTSGILIRRPDGRRYIGVNELHSNTRRRFSVADELGHAILHFDDNHPEETEAVVDRPLEVMFRDGLASQGSNKLEIDANAFAAELLMPCELVEGRLLTALQTNVISIDYVVDELAAQFEVSPQAMRYRLINLGLADPT